MDLALAVYEEITGSSELPPPVDEADIERRSHRRMPFGFRATILPLRKGVEGPASVVMVRDISVGGVSILHEEALKQGTSLTIEFKGAGERPVKIQCTVARCEQGGTGGTQYVIGATFEELLTKDLPPVPAEQPVEPLSDPSQIQGKPVESETEEQAAPMPAPAVAEAVEEVVEMETEIVTEQSPKEQSAEPLDETADIIEWLNEADQTTEKPEEDMENKAAPASEELKEEVVAQAQTPEEPVQSSSDQAKILGRLAKSEAEAEAEKKALSPETEAAAKAPQREESAKSSGDQAKTTGKLFKSNSETEKKSKQASAASEEGAATKSPPAKPAAPGEPIWTDVPVSPEPAETAPVAITLSPTETPEPVQPAEPVQAMSIVRDAVMPAGQAAVRNHEVLTRVQSLLSTQKQTLEKRDREIQTLSGEVAELKRKISQLQAKSDADDKSISELATFLAKEVGDVAPKENENVAA